MIGGRDFPATIVALAKPNGDQAFGTREPSVLVRFLYTPGGYADEELLLSREEARVLEAQLHHANAAFELAETISDEHRKIEKGKE